MLSTAALLLMTGQAAGAFGKRRRLVAAAFEAEVGPLLREPALVFHRRFDADDLLLKATALEDRSLIGRRPQFEHEHRPIGPLAGAHELAIRLRTDASTTS
ncbi:MAG: hypothetical protein AUJ01_12785 [Acidobacteria bacterium 13_1_40CM_3_65_5]|nr:MAG: hypothetical protein AUJ01_12785 [Acidobacteria bacterium 13_1_40CM_3_65_5]